MDASEAKRLRELGPENGKLKRLLAEAHLDIDSLKGYWAQSDSPTSKGEAVSSMVNHHKLFERHACALVGLSRDSYRYVGKTSALNVDLRDGIVESAHTRKRWGYRMIHDVLRPHYPGINHNRVYRIFTVKGLLIRKRKRALRVGVRVPLTAALAVNHVEHGLCKRRHSKTRRNVAAHQMPHGGR